MRLGKDHDGGYLVEAQSLRQTARLLAFGLSDDWSFEKDFLRRRPVPLASYDPTLTEAHLYSVCPHRKLAFKVLWI